MLCISANTLDAQVTDFNAKSDTIPVYQLSEIVVLGERLPDSDPIPAYILKKEELQKLDVNDSRQALEYVPGLYFSKNVRNENSFRLRGFDQRQVNIYLDGIPVSVPFDGTLDISQLAGDNLENIRVSKAISSVLYGANTLGGNVNFITSLPSEKQELKVRFEGSNQQRIFGSLLLKNSWERLVYIASIAYEKAPDFQLPKKTDSLQNNSGNTRNNSAFKKNNLGLKFHYTINKRNKVGLHINTIINSFNVPPNTLVSSPRYWQFPEWQKSVISFNSEHVISNSLVLRTVWFFDKYRNVLESYDDDTYTTQSRRYAFTSIYDDFSTGVSIYPVLSYFKWGTTRGIFSYKKDVHREKSDETQPFEKYSTEIWTSGLEQIIDISRGIQGLVGADLNYLRPIYAQELSLRNPILLLNGQTAVKWLIFANISVNGAVGYNSRFPTLKELYSERFGRNIANPDLVEERALNLELGLFWQKSTAQVGLTVFRNMVSDQIVNRQLGNDTQQYQNVGETLYQGFEFVLQKEWQIFEGSLNYTYLSAANASADRENDYLEYRPVHRLNVLAEFKPLSSFRISIEASYTADQYYQHPETLNWEKLNDFLTLNGKVGYDIDDWLNLYLRFYNLTDHFYFSEFGIPMPGREIVVGMKLRISP
jgi:iron complex outermembrane receptor protein